MITVGKTDVFERKYMEKFRAFASKFGEIVNYERDRGARDIGLHLTHKLKSGKERLSSAFLWFQMKGIMESTLSEEQLNDLSEVKISLEVPHLRYWYNQPLPTYLVLYIECSDLFLILNIQDYIEKKWSRDIFKLDQKTATVAVPKHSTLDEQAFKLILTKADIDEWKKVLGGGDEDTRICQRDYDLIWHLSSAEERNVAHRIIFWDWQSKNRSQFYIKEKGPEDKNWHTLREHWEYSMSVDDLEDAYPYIEFYSLHDGDDIFEEEIFEEDPEVPPLNLSNGDVVFGTNCSWELFKYEMGVRLNALGLDMYSWVNKLSEIGLIEISPGKSEIISVAPWHGRLI